LVTFAEQEVGTPNTCDHIFCVGCIKRWSKKVSTCPVDRQVFNVILVRRYSDRRIIRKIAVRQRPLRNQDEEIDVQYIQFCEVCEEYNREDRMISCTGCHRIYHLECLNPPLDAIPLEEWFCPTCIVLSTLFYAD
jgi:PHD and RING finger domain-containing protein 1